MTVARYAAARHIYVPVDGAGHVVGLIDQALARHGLSRRRSISMTQFAAVPPLIATSDFIMLAPHRMGALLRQRYGLATVPMPLELPLYETRLIWHPSFATRSADAWFRSFMLQVSSALPDRN
jgi:DNA-binding transcriptional LysR family regulator